MKRPGVALQMFALFWEPDVYWITFGGDGTIDPSPAIAAATGAEWLIVAQDFSDRPMLESIAQSRQYLRARGY